jgi:hypothetical protein
MKYFDLTWNKENTFNHYKLQEVKIYVVNLTLYMIFLHVEIQMVLLSAGIQEHQDLLA